MVSKIIPIILTGQFNVIAYPSPDEALEYPKLSGNQGRAEILMRFNHGEKLHHNELIQNGELKNLEIFSPKIEWPNECVICNKLASNSIVVESCSEIKVSAHRVVLDFPNASRIWTSLQTDRFWFSVPVCNIHNNRTLLEHSISIDLISQKRKMLFKFPNKG